MNKLRDILESPEVTSLIDRISTTHSKNNVLVLSDPEKQVLACLFQVLHGVAISNPDLVEAYIGFLEDRTTQLKVRSHE